jgi:hypothetical protein
VAVLGTLRRARIPAIAVAAVGIAWTAVALAVAVFGHDPLSPDEWLRGDAVHYLSIADRGYELFRCTPDLGFASDQWCGNAGWFPAYPWLLSLVGLSGLSLQTAGLLLSGLLLCATLAVVLVVFVGPGRDARILAMALVAAFFPGQIYLLAGFPLSMLALCSVSALALLERSRWRAALVPIAVAAATYPLGVLLGPAAAIVAVRSGPARARATHAAAAVASSAVGLGSVLVVQRVQTGAWDAFFLVQDKYAHGLNDPLVPVVHAVRDMRYFAAGSLDRTLIPSFQTFLCAAIVVALLVALVRGSGGLSARGRTALATFVVTAWLAPLVLGGVNLYRSEAALLPAVVLLPRLALGIRLALLAALVPLDLAMAVLFFDGVLV